MPATIRGIAPRSIYTKVYARGFRADSSSGGIYHFDRFEPKHQGRRRSGRLSCLEIRAQNAVLDRIWPQRSKLALHQGSALRAHALGAVIFAPRKLACERVRSRLPTTSIWRRHGQTTLHHSPCFSRSFRCGIRAKRANRRYAQVNDRTHSSGLRKVIKRSARCVCVICRPIVRRSSRAPAARPEVAVAALAAARRVRPPSSGGASSGAYGK
jgi:hypothetical protein